EAGAGAGAIRSVPNGISCGVTCSSAYPNGTTVKLSAGASVGSTFLGWSGGSCSGTGECLVTVSGTTSVAAMFAPQSGSLTVTKTGTGTGSVTSAPGGISCGGTGRGHSRSGASHRRRGGPG